MEIRLKTDLLLPFAKEIKTGNLAFVDEVPSGLACNCVCVHCEMPVVAFYYTDRRSHFKHAPRVTSDEVPCVANIERAVFWLCRSILESNNEIKLPKYTTKYKLDNASYTKKCTVTECQIYAYRDVKFRPAYESGNTELATIKTENMNIALALSYDPLETTCYFTNIQSDTARVEICISSLAEYISNISSDFREQVRNKLLYDVTLRTWHYHPHENMAIREHIQLDKLRDKELYNSQFKQEQHRSMQANTANVYDRLFSEFTPTKKTKEVKQYENRTIRCPKCTYIWSDSVINLPYSQKLVDCPNCYYGVFL